jgi:hypothetical protein
MFWYYQRLNEKSKASLPSSEENKQVTATTETKTTGPTKSEIAVATAAVPATISPPITISSSTLADATLLHQGQEFDYYWKKDVESSNGGDVEKRRLFVRYVPHDDHKTDPTKLVCMSILYPSSIIAVFSDNVSVKIGYVCFQVCW